MLRLARYGLLVDHAVKPTPAIVHVAAVTPAAACAAPPRDDEHYEAWEEACYEGMHGIDRSLRSEHAK